MRAVETLRLFFECPRCGTTSQPRVIDILPRQCLGKIGANDCGFSWPQEDDGKYFSGTPSKNVTAKTPTLTHPPPVTPLPVYSLASTPPAATMVVPIPNDLVWDVKLVRDARDFVRNGVEDGAYCPCCGKWVFIHKRSLYYKTAEALILLYKYDLQHLGEWIHISSFLLSQKAKAANGGEVSLLTNWGLLEENQQVQPTSGKKAGYYRITDLGGKFVRGECRVPKYNYYYSGECIGKSVSETVSIKEALGETFDYDEYMSRSIVS